MQPWQLPGPLLATLTAPAPALPWLVSRRHVESPSAPISCPRPFAFQSRQQRSVMPRAPGPKHLSAGPSPGPFA